jgi:hypothetical protein
MPLKKAGGLPFSIDTIALYFQRLVYQGVSSDGHRHGQLPDLPKSGRRRRKRSPWRETEMAFAEKEAPSGLFCLKTWSTRAGRLKQSEARKTLVNRASLAWDLALRSKGKP